MDSADQDCFRPCGALDARNVVGIEGLPLGAPGPEIRGEFVERILSAGSEGKAKNSQEEEGSFHECAILRDKAGEVNVNAGSSGKCCVEGGSASAETSKSRRAVPACGHPRANALAVFGHLYSSGRWSSFGLVQLPAHVWRERSPFFNGTLEKECEIMATAVAAPSIDSNVSSFVARKQKLLINGKWVEAASGKTFPSYNPATGEVLAHVAEGDREDIDRAVKAARAAFETGPWSKISPATRGKMIWKLADLIEKHLEEFAQIESLDNGKPLAIARVADVPLTIEHMRYYAGWATKIEGNTIPLTLAPPSKFLAYTVREPVGVVGQIIPWNFPLLMAAWKLGPALAAGCTVVLKPAEQTPLSALRLGELLQEAGFPDGVVNIVPGYGETAGAALASHPRRR